MTLFDILQDTAGVREKVPSKNAPPPTYLQKVAPSQKNAHKKIGVRKICPSPEKCPLEKCKQKLDLLVFCYY